MLQTVIAFARWHIGERGSTEFLCDCAHQHCFDKLELSLREYEEIRASPVRFPFKVGHDYPVFERVVAVSDGYAVVEKIGAAAEVKRGSILAHRVKRAGSADEWGNPNTDEGVWRL
jgi:hypothetical protein